MASKPSFTEILKTAKSIQNQVSQAQKDMQNKRYSVDHPLFSATIGGDDMLYELTFTQEAKDASLEEIANILITELNRTRTHAKKESKERMASITKDMMPGGLGDE